MEHNTTQTQNNTTLYNTINNPIQYVYVSACPFYAHRGMVGLQQIWAAVAARPGEHIGGVHIDGVHIGEARCSAPQCNVLHMVCAVFEQS